MFTNDFSETTVNTQHMYHERGASLLNVSNTAVVELVEGLLHRTLHQIDSQTTYHPHPSSRWQPFCWTVTIARQLPSRRIEAHMLYASIKANQAPVRQLAAVLCRAHPGITLFNLQDKQSIIYVNMCSIMRCVFVCSGCTLAK